MDAERTRIPLASFLPGLQKITASKCNLILVAGQAVNFWALFYSKKFPQLLDYAPFVSKDVDLFGDAEDLYRLPSLIDGSLQRFRDTRQPIVGVFTTNSKPPLIFEILRGVYGDIPTSKIKPRARIANGISVIDPITLLAAKIFNVAGIDQEKRQDKRHVEMMAIVVNAYFLEILDSVDNQITPRQFINEVRYLLDLSEKNGFTKGLTTSGLKLTNCIPSEMIRRRGEVLPSIGRFHKTTLSKALAP